MLTGNIYWQYLTVRKNTDGAAAIGLTQSVQPRFIH